MKLREQIILDKNKKHDIDVLVDEIFLSEFKPNLKDKNKQRDNAIERLSEALEKAIEEAQGLIKIEFPDEEKLMSVKFMCPYDGFSYPEIEPRLFSFNSPYGACPACNGLGTREFFTNEECPTCKGARLRPEALHVKIDGKNIVEVTAHSIEDGAKFFEEIKLLKPKKKLQKSF
jgi:excinuclease ABC subunit A